MADETGGFVAVRKGLVGNAVVLAGYALRMAKTWRQRPIRKYQVTRFVIRRAVPISRFPTYRSPWAMSKDRRI